MPKEDLEWEDEQNQNLVMLAKRYHLNDKTLLSVWNSIRNDVKR